ncbi:MAG: VOC family protein [Minisyncoccia bacterium]
MSNRVIHFEIQADNIERARDFYKKAFGWQIEKYKGEAPMEYFMVMTGNDDEPGINGGMYQRPTDNQAKMFDCTIQVDNIDVAIEAVKSNGGTITIGKNELPNVGFFARAVDTEGNTFAIMQPTGWQPK